MDLQSLQQQLKVAIQSHQILVAKMKADPQNAILQRQLHELQAEIMALSEKQKQVVNQLRKEIEIKQHQTVNSYTHHVQRAHEVVNHDAVITIQTTALPLVKATDLLPLKPVPIVATVTATTLAPKVVVNTIDQNRSVYVTSPLHIPKSVTSSAVATPMATVTAITSETTSTTMTVTTTSTSNVPCTNNTNGNGNSVCTALNLAPAIRVPQYPPLHVRPSVVQTQLRPPSLSPPIVHPPPSRIVARQNASVSMKDCESTTTTTVQPKMVSNSHTNSTATTTNNELFQKVDFMAALGLITHDTLSELQNRRSERKRRTTANPQFSYGNWELSEKKRKTNNYLTSPVPLNFRKPRGRPRLGSTPNNSCPATPDDGSSRESPNGCSSGFLRNGNLIDPDEVCALCQNHGDLLHCDTCMLSYHRNCIDSPPADSNHHPGSWICPKCQLMKKTPLQWPGSLAMVHSYIAHKAAKEEEKRKLMKRSLELKSEHSQLEHKAKQLSETIACQIQKRSELILHLKQTQDSIDVLKQFIKHFQVS